jgi:hypothetical protein
MKATLDQVVTIGRLMLNMYDHEIIAFAKDEKRDNPLLFAVVAKEILGRNSCELFLDIMRYSFQITENETEKPKFQALKRVLKIYSANSISISMS